MDKEKTDFLKKTMDKLENMRIYRKHIENQKQYFNFIYFNFQIILKAFCHLFEKKIKTEILIRAYCYLPKKVYSISWTFISINKNSNHQGC